MFNWDDKTETQKGYEAALEAVIGLMAQGRPVTEAAVETWLDIALEGIDEHRHIRRHAMSVAARLIRGPLRPPN